MTVVQWLRGAWTAVRHQGRRESLRDQFPGPQADVVFLVAGVGSESDKAFCSWRSGMPQVLGRQGLRSL